MSSAALLYAFGAGSLASVLFFGAAADVEQATTEEGRRAAVHRALVLVPIGAMAWPLVVLLLCWARRGGAP